MLLDDVKNALRVSGPDFDIEIQDLIEAAKADLALAGITKLDETDSLIKRAVVLYCKANFGYEDPTMAELFNKSYQSLKTHLALSQEYTVIEVTV